MNLFSFYHKIKIIENKTIPNFYATTSIGGLVASLF